MRVFESVDELSQAAADEFFNSAAAAIADRGEFIVALSGGSTPKRMHALLASPPYAQSIAWPHVAIVFGDERYVPPTDEQSNEKMARETLISKVSINPAYVFPMYVSGGPEEAARAYEAEMRDLLDGDLAIDLVLLGLGPDGHTASLFPGDASVHEQTRLVVASVASANARDRVTMTPGLINRARKILFLVAGEDKADALHRLVEGPIDFDTTPSQAIGRVAKNVEIFADRTAAARF